METCFVTRTRTCTKWRCWRGILRKYIAYLTLDLKERTRDPPHRIRFSIIHEKIQGQLYIKVSKEEPSQYGLTHCIFSNLKYHIRIPCPCKSIKGEAPWTLGPSHDLMCRSHYPN